MNKKILLVEDDPVLGETIQELLESENYIVSWVTDGQLALTQTYETSFDIFLLDLNIPFINGLELLDELRKSGDKTPAIFITANIDIESMKKGFSVGADDYLKKPFDVDELLIRIEVVLKKSFKTYHHTIIYGDLIYDTIKQQLIKNDKVVHLTPTEMVLFEYFIKNLDKVLSKDELISHTHNDFEGSEAVLRVQISKLKKIGLNIVNIRGVGYRCEKI
ncbi:MAG: response regulator transcription factor [Campylobacterota bacterium]|nr:response regulator transcription factor [Campylobacterota bacterium]